MCTIDGCENPVAIKSRGWCNKHYLRWRTHGDPEVMKRGGAEKCKLEGCESSVHAYGWCNKHYRRWFKGADINRERFRTGDTRSERFSSFVKIFDTDECIEWPSRSREKRGYGWFTFRRKNQRAHRASYEIHIGPIPAGQVVRHKCDNPPCVNPAHLELGTQADNINDAVKRGRISFGESRKHSKLTELQVLEIRELVKSRDVASIALEYGVSATNVRSIVKRKTWRHI